MVEASNDKKNPVGESADQTKFDPVVGLDVSNQARMEKEVHPKVTSGQPAALEVKGDRRTHGEQSWERHVSVWVGEDIVAHGSVRGLVK